jgi:hypothetical protein
MLSYRRVIETLNHFVEEAGDEKSLGDFCRYAAGAQAEQLVLVDLAGGCAVGATDVVRENFETGH